jgi:hypothetical protein
VQKERVDFDDVFTPVARMESVWLILAVTTHEDYKVHHMDVKSTFLNWELQKKYLFISHWSSPSAEKNKC